jgi:hypothetical protein
MHVPDSQYASLRLTVSVSSLPVLRAEGLAARTSDDRVKDKILIDVFVLIQTLLNKCAS